jgi:hypothetical protein
MTDNHFISPELADTMLAAMLSAHQRALTISQQLAAMYARCAPAINQLREENMQNYTTKHTSMVSQCCMAQTAPGA